MTDLALKDEVYAVIGAAIEVHKALGHGFLEAVYQEALEWELRAKGVPFESQKPLSITYSPYAATLPIPLQARVRAGVCSRRTDREDAVGEQTA